MAADLDLKSTLASVNQRDFSLPSNLLREIWRIRTRLSENLVPILTPPSARSQLSRFTSRYQDMLYHLLVFLKGNGQNTCTRRILQRSWFQIKIASEEFCASNLGKWLHCACTGRFK